MIAGQTTRHDDQARALRALVARESHQTTTIAITSGKGGVGKTNIAVNLAISLVQRGSRVCLLDLDLGLANADVLMNIPAGRNLSHVISGAASLEEIVQRGCGGVSLVPGASGLENLAELSDFERCRLLQQFRELEKRHDVVIMDLSAGVSENVLSFAGAADVVVVVTTPEPTAKADAYAMIKMLACRRRASDIELLVNFARNSREARQTFERIAGVASRFLGLPITSAGYVLEDDAVGSAVRAREPFMIRSPRCNAAACIRALARKFAVQAEQPSAAGGFFSRIAQMFL